MAGPPRQRLSNVNLKDHAGKMVKNGRGKIYVIGKDGSLRRTDFGKRPGKAAVKAEKRRRRVNR